MPCIDGSDSSCHCGLIVAGRNGLIESRQGEIEKGAYDHSDGPGSRRDRDLKHGPCEVDGDKENRDSQAAEKVTAIVIISHRTVRVYRRPGRTAIGRRTQAAVRRRRIRMML